MIEKQLLADLYNTGNSMQQIAVNLKCSHSKVAYWMKKYSLTRRTRSEATYLQFNPNGDPFYIKKVLNKQENFLFGLGLGIFWGEGTKVSKHSLRITNTDPAMILIFRKFLIEICGVRSEKIKYSLICFNDTSPKQVANYWSKMLKISSQNFGKITQISSQGKGTYRKKSQYGVCILYANNYKLKSWMDHKLEEIKSKPD